MNFLPSYFESSPVLALGHFSALLAALAVVPAYLSRPGRRVRFAVTVTLLVGAAACGFQAYSVAVRDAKLSARVVSRLMEYRARYNVAVLENTDTLPIGWTDYAKIEPVAGGFAGMSPAQYNEWHADRLAHERADLAYFMDEARKN